MNIRELINLVEEPDDEVSPEDEQVAAIGQLVADRTEDENSPSKLSADAFVGILQKMGLPYSKNTLIDLAQSGKLESVISNVSDEFVEFKGQGEIDPNVMSVDKARSTVNDMAKRSMNKSGLGSQPDPQEKEGYN